MLLLNLFTFSVVAVPKEKGLSPIRTGMYYLSTLYSTVKVIGLTVVLAGCFIDPVLCEVLHGQGVYGSVGLWGPG